MRNELSHLTYHTADLFANQQLKALLFIFFIVWKEKSTEFMIVHHTFCACIEKESETAVLNIREWLQFLVIHVLR